MSILHYNMASREELRVAPQSCTPGESQFEKRWERDALGDLKHGLDLIFELKSALDELHPIAAETLIRLILQ